MLMHNLKSAKAHDITQQSGKAASEIVNDPDTNHMLQQDTSTWRGDYLSCLICSELTECWV